MTQQQPLDDIIFLDITSDINELDAINENADENGHQDKLKKKNVKVAHHPLGRTIVQLTDLIHEIIK